MENPMENFSLDMITHDLPTTPSTEKEHEEHLKASATTFLNLPPQGTPYWSVDSFSDLKHTYYARVKGAEYKITQEYLDHDDDPQWCVEIIFKPTDTGSLTLHYDGLDEIAKMSWVKTPEGFVISDFEGYQAMIEADNITEIISDDDDGVVSMSQILSRLKNR
jgi:hypothetical protein